MLKPFIILALPRTGTKMLVSALSSHPDIPTVTHEFVGTEDEYWKHPYVLSNYIKDWMDDRIVKIHMYREDAVAGARSMLLMSYNFPDGVVDLPAPAVIEVAKQRQEWDAEFSADWSFSYESLGKNVTDLPQDFTEKFCELVGITPTTLTAGTQPGHKLRLRNQDEIDGLTY